MNNEPKWEELPEEYWEEDDRKKKMFSKITFPPKPMEFNADDPFNVTSIIIRNAVLKVNEEIDKNIEKTIYEIYKDSDISELYVISEPEFRKFLLEMLPKYLNKEDN